VEKILVPSENNTFLKEFIPFCRRVAHFGILNSLSQTLIKITSPGVPDFYQGSELWDLSLVDPDNRRPVDFARRRSLLASIRAQEAADIDRLVQSLLSTREDGAIKLFLIYRALKAKQAHGALFCSGAYLPLESTGKFSNHVIAFAWRHQRQWALVMGPRFVSHLISEGDFPLGKEVWQDTRVILPHGTPTAWRNILTDEEILSGENALPVGDILLRFPVALLIGEGKEEYLATG